MGGYVTWERPTPGHGVDTFYMKGYSRWTGAQTQLTPVFYTNTQGSMLPRLPIQSTYSYRSGVEYDGATDLEFLLDHVQGSSLSRVRALESYDTNSYDQGHPFDTYSTRWEFSHPVWKGQLSSNIDFEGLISPAIDANSFGPPLIELDPNPLEDYGPTAIRDTVPTRSAADLAQALIELKREGLPRLLGANFLRGTSRGALPRKGSEEYLNLEFGIKPVIRDLQEVSRAVLQSRELLKQFLADSGRKLHRTRTFPPTTRSGVYSNWTVIGRPQRGPMDTRYAFVGYGATPLYDAWTVHEQVYFKGAYSYYLDPGWFKGTLGAYRQAERLLGLRLTPELLWELTPWSWLFDWVTNIGDNVSNLTALGSDNLVLRYGYLMRHTRASRIRVLKEIVPKYGTSPSLSPSAQVTYERKERIRASPYGFGLDPDTFSARQWSILSALGMTRGNRSLRLSD